VDGKQTARRVAPEWQVDLDDVEETQTAVSTDALRSTRPIRTKVETPDEINEVFDGIAYQKTASVLRTIENYVGSELFRKGVTSYLRKYSFANAAGNDFWTEVARVTGKPVDRIMKPYIEQSGVPVVKIETKCAGNATELALHQERFVGMAALDVARGKRRLKRQFAAVDHTRMLQDGGEPATVRDPRPPGRESVAVELCRRRRRQRERRGYYFSEYSPEDARAIARTARGSLVAAERLSFLGDEWWMVRAGRHDIGVYLDSASSLAGDEAPSVIEQIGRSLAYTHEDVVQGSDVPRFEEWVRRRFTPELTSLGLPGNVSDPDDRQSRRATLLYLVGGHRQFFRCAEAGARSRAEVHRKPAVGARTLASTVLNVAAFGGDAMLYDRYISQLPKLSTNRRSITGSSTR